MNRELYFYWRVAPTQLARATAVLRAWQATLAQQHPGLQARLLCRSDDGATLATVMETYVSSGGIPAALQEAIVEHGAQVATPWCEGPRHLEVFVPVLES